MVRGVRVTIWPEREAQAVTSAKAGAVKNIIDGYLSRRGLRLDRSRPAPYGFGIVARRARSPESQRLYRIEQIRIGSTDQEMMRALRELTASELWEPSMVEGAGLDLRASRLAFTEAWTPVDAVAGYAVSPIRVLDTRPGAPKHQAMKSFGPDFDAALNRTMERRFGRPFRLRFVPDQTYVRLHRGDVTASIAIHAESRKLATALDGVVLPFLLTGPEDDIAEAWFNGLGSATGVGCGWWEVADA